MTTLETKPLIIPERPQAPEATLILQRLNSDSIHHHNEPTNILDITLLEKIKSFLTFAGCLHNPSLNNIPTILFKVKYHSGATGFVNCASTIRGKPKNIEQSFHMHAKVRYAKDLISDGDWEYMAHRFGYSKARTMQFEWLQVMRGKALYTELPAVNENESHGDGASCVGSGSYAPSASTSSSCMGRGKWGVGVGIGIAVAVGLGVGVALGFGVGLGFGLGVGIGLFLMR
ncbi:uncharacterized protein APUU_10340A [Aspergillus puulaauensis]|uniref:Uncharacterized protein n=1 Tax=Aspergillus puulaauensis TaxID=1220207 RepID=A0A7R7X9V0_9EURO|nr:uncharacterized protein APUU_10340A [Aspergillus puulaauensis]BCS17512.1 hypothetical protein APUU_10340A [Aspergillus puulaauensis]